MNEVVQRAGTCCLPHLPEHRLLLPTAPRFSRLPLVVSGCFQFRAHLESQTSKLHRLLSERQGTGIWLAHAVLIPATSVTSRCRPSLCVTLRTVPHQNHGCLPVPRRRPLPLPAIWPPKVFPPGAQSTGPITPADRCSELRVPAQEPPPYSWGDTERPSRKTK